MSGAFPNEPSGFTVTHDCSFNQTLPSGVLDVYNSAVYITDGTAPLSGPYVMDVALAAGASSGGVQLNSSFNGRPREVFAGFWIKTNADFEGYINSNNKVLFIRAPGSGDNSCMVWQGAQNAPKTLKWYQQGIVNNTHVSGVYGTNYPTDGTGWFNPNINSAVATFAAGSGWHKVEIRLRASTTGTSRDGVIQIWVDGTLSTSHFNINISPGGFEDWIITPTWDGQSAATCAYRDCAKSWHWYWDHLYVSAISSSSGSVPVLSSLSPSTVTLTPGNTQTFSATMSSAVSANTTIALTSSSSAVATVGASAVVPTGSVSTNFTVTGVASGSATISASLSGVTKTSTVTVSSSSGSGSTSGTPTTYTYASQFSGVQGQNQWSYRDSGGNLLVYNGSNKWEGDELYLAIWDSGFVHGYTASKKSAVLRWTAPAVGSAAVSGTALLYDSSGLGTFTINYNSSTAKFGPQTMTYGVSYPYSFTQAVAAGDTIDFVMSGTSSSTNDNTQLNPVIVFTPTTSGGSTVTISSMSPSSGNIGSSVTIVGTGFSATAINNTITVNGVPATITSASTTQLVFTVPTTATTGLVNVSTSGGSASAGTFTVNDPVTPDVPPASNFGGNAMLLLVLP